MSSVIYAIVFSGGIVDGFQKISVKAHLAQLLKADADKMAMLFSGKQIVLKRTPDKQQALKYGTALKKVGADVKIKALKVEQATPASTPEAAAPEAATTGGLTLAPNTGNLVEPRPAPPAPEIDTSGIELAADDGSPLVAPTPLEEIEFDLSEYSLGEQDGSPLTEPAAPAPKLDAPDFGLDEPGAVLQTQKEEAEPVSPDISSLTLAEPGADLLTPTDKPPAPAPQVPDTSNIHLVPNLD